MFVVRHNNFIKETWTARSRTTHEVNGESPQTVLSRYAPSLKEVCVMLGL